MLSGNLIDLSKLTEQQLAQIANNVKKELEIRLGDAAYQGELDEVKKLVEQYGVDVNTCTGREHQTGPHVPLIAAANYGRTEIVKYLLEKKAQVNAVAEYGRTALMYAVSDCTGRRIEDYANTAKLLIQAGADVNATDETGQTPLMHAVQNNNLLCIEALLESNANVNLVDHEGKSALHHIHYFPDENTEAILLKLLAHGADVTIEDENHFTPLMIAAENGKNANLVNILLNVGANKNDLFKDGKTELMYAAAWNDLEWAEKLIKEHAKDVHYLSKQDNQGVSALMLAAQQQNLPFVKLLLKNDKPKLTDDWYCPLVQQVDKKGRNALLYALNEEVFICLINAGSNINQVDDSRQTALTRAVHFRYPNALTLLLEKNINKEVIDTKTKGGWFHDGTTALYEAVRRARNNPGEYDNIEMNKNLAIQLLTTGANPNIKCDGLTVFQICGHPEIRNMLDKLTAPKSNLPKLSLFAGMPTDVSDTEMAHSHFARPRAH